MGVYIFYPALKQKIVKRQQKMRIVELSALSVGAQQLKSVEAEQIIFRSWITYRYGFQRAENPSHATVPLNTRKKNSFCPLPYSCKPLTEGRFQFQHTAISVDRKVNMREIKNRANERKHCGVEYTSIEVRYLTDGWLMDDWSKKIEDRWTNDGWLMENWPETYG